MDLPTETRNVTVATVTSEGDTHRVVVQDVEQIWVVDPAVGRPMLAESSPAPSWDEHPIDDPDDRQAVGELLRGLGYALAGEWEQTGKGWSVQVRRP